MDIAGLEFAEEQASWRGGAPGEAGLEKGRSCGGRGPERAFSWWAGSGKVRSLGGQGSARGVSCGRGSGRGGALERGRAGPCCVTGSALAGGGGSEGAESAGGVAQPAHLCESCPAGRAHPASLFRARQHVFRPGGRGF